MGSPKGSPNSSKRSQSEDTISSKDSSASLNLPKEDSKRGQSLPRISIDLPKEDSSKSGKSLASSDLSKTLPQDTASVEKSLKIAEKRLQI